MTKYLTIPAKKVYKMPLDVVIFCDQCYHDPEKDVVVFVNPQPTLIKIVRSLFP